MGNYVKGFRFTNEYEDVFSYYDDGLYTYVSAEPWGFGYTMTATDYRKESDGTYSMGSTYPVTIDQLVNEWVPEYQADVRTAAEIVGLEFARAYYFYEGENVEERAMDCCDVLSMVDVAACHTLETMGAPDVFEPTDNESMTDFYGRWRKSFRQCGMDAVC